MVQRGIPEHRTTFARDPFEAMAQLHVEIASDPTRAFIEVFSPTSPENHAVPRELEGICFAVKDNIAVRGHAAQAGSPAITPRPSETDAVVVATLRAAGAMPVGSLNMHELALGTTSDNAHFGAVRNPRDLTRSAGGSSGGTAAAVAGGLIPFALGTDTGGSNLIPAAFCGIVGMRPTTGRYSTTGLISISPTRDTIGVMANTVTDVALVDSLITDESEWPTVTLAGLRLGVPRPGYFDDLDPEVAAVTELALGRLAAAGATLVEMEISGSHEIAEPGFNVVAFETPRAILRLLSDGSADADNTTQSRPIAPQELTDEDWAQLRIFADQVASPDVANILRHFISAPVTVAQYRAALDDRTTLQATYAAAFDTDHLAAVIYPTVPILAPLLGTSTVSLNGRELDLFPASIRNTDAGSFAGQPAVSLPISRVPGTLPIGLSVEGRRGEDRRLLAISREIEKALDGSLSSYMISDMTPEGVATL